LLDELGGGNLGFEVVQLLCQKPAKDGDTNQRRTIFHTGGVPCVQ
jgi:hypothetical protein